MTPRIATILFAAAVALTAHGAAAKPAENAAPPASCETAVAILGASMGAKPITGDDGDAAYLYVVRANGFDYEVTCDAKSGVVSDVSPRRTP